MSTLGLDESLERFWKTVTCTVTVHHSARTQMNISKGRRCMGTSPGVVRREFPGIPSQWSCTGTLPEILPAMMCDNTCKAVHTREAHTSLDIQGFYRGSVMEAWSPECVTTTGTPFPQHPAPSPCQSKTSIHQTQRMAQKSLPGEIVRWLRSPPRIWPRAILTAGFSLKCAAREQLRPSERILSCLDKEWDLELK